MILVHVEAERNIKTVAEDRHNRKKGVIVVELDQFRYKISGFEKPMEQIKKSLDLENKKKRIEELEADMEAPGFWDNTETLPVEMHLAACRLPWHIILYPSSLPEKSVRQ